MTDYRHRQVCERKGHSWVTYFRHPTDDGHPIVAAWNKRWANRLEFLYGYIPIRRACYWCGATNLQTSRPSEQRVIE